MSYVRSCAVNSIVGHMLGIGDRHASNLLIHEKSGEVVHIDFGYVFEQGKLLSIPETIPFRLTRDIVDGMGPLGTRGLFTVSSKAVTKVLRENASDLLTILSAVVSDPLYKWCINPFTASKYRHIDNNDRNENKDMDSSMRTKKNICVTDEMSNSEVMEEIENDAANRAI